MEVSMLLSVSSYLNSYGLIGWREREGEDRRVEIAKNYQVLRTLILHLFANPQIHLFFSERFFGITVSQWWYVTFLKNGLCPSTSLIFCSMGNHTTKLWLCPIASPNCRNILDVNNFLDRDNNLFVLDNFFR